MPLTLETVNLISDGQAVTADNLNAPSVNLVNRTDAIKSSYDVAETERVILRGYHTALTGGTRPTVTVEAGEVTPEGDKFYSLSLSSVASLRYSSPLSNMGRVELTRAQLSSYSTSEGNDWSKHLVRVGDTLAIEMDAHPDLSSAPNSSLVGAAQGDSADLDNAFITVTGDVQLVKLPYRDTLEFDSSQTLAQILSQINTELATLDPGASFSLDSDGVLQTANAGGAVLEISADAGTLYGIVYSMVVDSGGKVYVTTTSETAFLDYNSSINVNSVFRIRLGENSASVTPAGQSNRSIKAGNVDLNKIYIPVATLEGDGVRVHGVGKCRLPLESGDVEVISPDGRSTKRYLAGETYTVESVLSRASTENSETTAVVSIPEALADQIQDYGGHVLLRAFSITTLASFADSGTQPTFTATARLDLVNFSTTTAVLASSLHMPAAGEYLETGINLLADATASSLFGSPFAYEPSVSVTVSGLAPDADAKALLRLSFSYVPA